MFCAICKAMRGAGHCLRRRYELNFNLISRSEWRVGWGSVRPNGTRPTRSTRKSSTLGVLDTLGYLDFTNADSLVEAIQGEDKTEALGPVPIRRYREAPLYVMKGPIDTDGAVQLLSLLKKSHIGFRTYDPAEAPRLPLHKARQEVSGSFGVFAHLLSPKRDGAGVQRSLAFVSRDGSRPQKTCDCQEISADQRSIYRDLVGV